MKDFTETVIGLIRSIPAGKVSTYGKIAAMAGNPYGARQVSRILHSMSRKYDLPWYRIVNSNGGISLPEGRGYEEQKSLLESEGIIFEINGRIDFVKYLWKGDLS